MNQRTKLPVRRVYANDLAIPLEDGEVVYPHAGEWVETRRLGSVGNWLQLVADTKFAPDMQTDEGVEQMAARWERQLEITAHGILAWNWTDATTGEPLPAPSVEVMRTLAFPEQRWLFDAIQGTAGELIPLTDGSPSTAPSAGEAEDEPPMPG